MGFKLRYIENPAEGYKTVKAKMDGGVQKYKMVSIKNKTVEYPNNSVIQSITKRFMTQRNYEPIYSSAYGVDWAKFIGRDMTSDLPIAIEQEIQDSLRVCKFVESVNVAVGALDGSSVAVNCEVTINGKYTVSKQSEKVVIATQINI